MVLTALRRYLVWLFIILACPAAALAHPHVFVDCTLSFIFDEKGLAGIRQQWVFDEMFSETILWDHDADRDSSLSEEEILSIKKGAFDNLKQFEYFTHIVIDNRRFPVQWVTDFTAIIQSGRLAYSFFVPCHVSAADTAKQIRVAVFDPEYYTDITFDQDSPFCRAQQDRYTIHCSREYLPELKYYFGQIVPQGIFLRFKLQ